MADAFNDIFNQLFNGTTGGIPNIYIIIGIGFMAFLIYMVATRKPKVKEFRPLDMKRETKRRFKKEYKYFGKPVNKNIFDAHDAKKPLAYVIGYMKVVEMEAMKRLEPIYTRIPKDVLDKQHDKNAKQIYGVSYAELNATQKKNIDEVAKEELRNEKIETTTKDRKTKIVKGKKEIDFSVPVPMYCFKICSPNIASKIFARFLGFGIDWAIFNKDQIQWESDKIILTADFQRRTPFDIFVFSPAGKNLVQDITYGQERENIWQETANQIPRAVHFDTEASKSLIFRREDAKIEKDKRRSQTESREFR